MNLTTDKIIIWSKSYSNWLPVIQWSGWIVITMILAKLFWVVTLHITNVDVSNQTVSLVSKSSQSQSRKSAGVSEIVSRHLFGSTERAVVMDTVETDVVETRLNLKLKGTYASRNSNHSNSIIEDGKGKQEVYFLNDKLKVSGRVFLKQVFLDRVIIENNGVKEELRLQDKLPELARSKSKNKLLAKKGKNKNRRVDKRENKQISRSLNKYRERLLQNPLSLTEVIGYRPKIVSGEMIGITISPGKDKRLFTQLGLRRNDIVTSINGVSLSDPKNALQLMSDIQNMQELQIDINRGNETISLLLNLNDKVGL